FGILAMLFSSSLHPASSVRPRAMSVFPVDNLTSIMAHRRHCQQGTVEGQRPKGRQPRVPPSGCLLFDIRRGFSPALVLPRGCFTIARDKDVISCFPQSDLRSSGGTGASHKPPSHNSAAFLSVPSAITNKAGVTRRCRKRH